VEEKIKLFMKCRKCGKVEDEKWRGTYPCSGCGCIVFDFDPVTCNEKCSACQFEKSCIEKPIKG